jgi:glutathione synthase/RimK-type ligase-like ATP-grasp enzyme
MSIPARYRLALATCEAIPAVYPDDEPLVAALQALRIEPVPCIWSDPAVDWSRFDAVLIRTTWDYFQRYEEFCRWLDRLPVPVINPAPLLRWNADKRYLLELQAQGVPVIASRVAAGRELAQLLTSREGEDLVVKPTISGGAWLTVRGRVGSPEFADALESLPLEREYLVQAFVPEIVAAGEWSLLFFDGGYSHAVLKRPQAGDYRVQSQHGGSVEGVAPPPALVESGRRVLAALAALGFAAPAYARIDGVVVAGEFQLMELEVIEPALFLSGYPDAAATFAAALNRRLCAPAAGPSGRAETRLF